MELSHNQSHSQIKLVAVRQAAPTIERNLYSLFLYASLSHNYSAFPPDQKNHPYKQRIIISEALFLKALFSHVSCSEILILPHSISGIIIFKKKIVEIMQFFCNIQQRHESTKHGIKVTRCFWNAQQCKAAYTDNYGYHHNCTCEMAIRCGMLS